MSTVINSTLITFGLIASGIVAIAVLARVSGGARGMKSARLPNAQKRTWLDDADPARVAHESKCEACGVVMPVLMSQSRLERRPWRLVWWCRVCGRQSRALCPPELVPTLMEWDRAFGTSLSLREVAEWVSVDLDGLAQAVEDELS
ncbi:MAG TPA: hypothetical protein VIG24_14205 [Acidimicrobiia bacterium]